MSPFTNYGKSEPIKYVKIIQFAHHSSLPTTHLHVSAPTYGPFITS